MKKPLKDLVGRFVVRRRNYDELVRIHEEETARLRQTWQTWVPPGHFYSPHPDLADADAWIAATFGVGPPPAGIDMHEPDQVALFDTLAELAQDLPFPDHDSDGFRYYFDNPAYAWGDGLVLCAMLRHLQPRRVVEVGSGYSSALMLDTAERWLRPDIELTFVEPFSELLRRLLRPGDEQRVTIHEEPVQAVSLDVFTELEAGDVLFVDSTHVVKPGSDVNRLVFEVLPCLAPGVSVHFHDVFFPFEYPQDWVREGRAWQEAYLLRAFLMFNPTFEIRWFQQFMWSHHRPLLEQRIPLMAKNPGGNLWLQRV